MNYKIFPSLMQSTKYKLKRVSNGCTIDFEPNINKFRQNVAQVINDTEESILKQELEKAGWINPEHVALMEAVIEAANELRIHSDSSIDDQWQDNSLDWDKRLLELEVNEYKAVTMLMEYRKERGLL